MDNVLEELATISWSYKSFTPNELVKQMASFPMVVRTESSDLGDWFYQDFSTDQVLYLHSVQEQFRFVAEDGQSNEISLPINTQINLLKVNINKGKAQCEEMHLKKDMTLPQIVKARCRRTNQENSDSDTEEDYIVMNIKQRGVMKYIMGTCISTDGVSTYIECIPVDYSEISFKVALNMSDNQLAKFERRVQDVVLSIIPESEFISYQGNPEIIINAQPNFIEIEKEHAYTPQKASANYLKNYNRQTTKKNNPRVLISPRKEQRIYIPVRLKSQKPNYENTKTSENKNLGPSSSVEEPDYLECIKKGLWNLKKPPPVPTKSGKTTLVSPTSNMRRISEGQNRPSTLPKPTNIIQKPKLLQKPVVIKKPSKTEQIGIVPIDTRPSVPLKTPEKEAPPSLPQRPQLKAPKPSDFRQNQLLGTSMQSLRNDNDDDDDDDNDYCNEELPTYRPPCVHNSDNDEEFDDEFDDDFDSDDDKDDDDVESDDDDYDKIEQFIFEVYSRKTDYQSTSKSPIRLPIEESAEYVEVPEKNTKSKDDIQRQHRCSSQLLCSNLSYPKLRTHTTRFTMAKASDILENEMQKMMESVEEIIWSKQTYTVQDIYARSSFPILARVEDSFLGDHSTDSYSTGEILWINGGIEQNRVIMESHKGECLSIPISKNFKIRKANREYENYQPLSETFVESEMGEWNEISDVTLYNRKNDHLWNKLGGYDYKFMRIIGKHSETFLTAYCLCNEMSILDCPVSVIKHHHQQTFVLGIGLNAQTFIKWTQFCHELASFMNKSIKHDDPTLPGITSYSKEHAREIQSIQLLSTEENEFRNAKAGTNSKDKGTDKHSPNLTSKAAEKEKKKSKTGTLRLRRQPSDISPEKSPKKSRKLLPQVMKQGKKKEGKYGKLLLSTDESPRYETHVSVPDNSCYVDLDKPQEQYADNISYCSQSELISSAIYPSISQSDSSIYKQTNLSKTPISTPKCYERELPTIPPSNVLVSESNSYDVVPSSTSCIEIPASIPECMYDEIDTSTMHRFQTLKIKDGPIRQKDDLPQDLRMLTLNQVQDCLQLLHLERLVDTFKENDIDGVILCDLSRDILIDDLGLTKIEALKLRKFIDQKWLPNRS